MAIHFTDADRVAGFACVAAVKERESPDSVNLAAVFTDRISDAMRPERELSERWRRDALRLLEAVLDIREIAAEAIILDTIELGIMDRIRNAATAALKEVGHA